MTKAWRCAGTKYTALPKMDGFAWSRLAAGNRGGCSTGGRPETCKRICSDTMVAFCGRCVVTATGQFA